MSDTPKTKTELLEEIRILRERVAELKQGTDRRQTESPPDSEASYRRAMEAVGAVPYCLNPQTDQYEFIGAGIEKLTGYRPEEIDRRTFTALQEEYELQGDLAGLSLPQALQKISRGETNVWRMDCRIHTKSGEKRWISDTAVFIRDEENAIVRSIGILQDITDRKRIEKGLQQQAEFESLIAKLSTRFINIEPQEIDNNIIALLETVGRFSGADRGYVFLFRDNSELVDNTHEWCAEGIDPQIDHLQGIDLDRQFPWFAERIKRGEVVHIPSVADLPDEAAAEKAEFQRENIRSLVNVPMIAGGTWIGFVGFDAVRTLRVWSEYDIAVLRMVGEIVVNAIQRKRTQEALKNTEALYVSLVENLPQYIYRKDLEGRFTFANDRFCSMLGEPLHEIIGKTDFDFYPPELAEKYRADERQVIESGGILERIEENQPPGGKRIYVQVLKTPVHDAAGNIIGTQGIFWDITERKQAEEALRESEHFLADVFNAIQDGISVLDCDLTVLRVNTWIERMYASQVPLAGKKCYEAYHGRKSPCPVCPTRRALQTGRTATEVVPYTVEKETQGWLELSAFPWKHRDGRIVGVIEYVKNVTERVRAQNAVKDSEALYSSLVENLPTSVYRRDLDGRFTFANKKFCATLGKTVDQIIGKTDFDFYPPELAEKYREDDLKVIKTGEVLERIEENQPPGGKRIYVQVLKTPVRDATGHIIGTQGIFWDITRYRKVEEALRRSEQEFEELYENAPVGYHEIDREGRIVRVNRTEAEMLGYAPEELLGRYMYEFVHESEREATKEAIHRKIRGEQALGYFERPYLRKDGREILVAIEEKLVRDDEGKIIGIRSTLQDTTERRQAEKELRESRSQLQRAQEVARIGSWNADLTKDEISWSDQVYQIFGLKRGEFDGRRDTFFSFVHPDDRQLVTDAGLKTISTGVPNNIDYRIVRSDETVIWVNQQAEALRDKEGNVVGLTGTVQDITDRKRSEEEQNRLQEQLRQAQKMEAIGQLAGGVAHDFNNLLTGIIGNVSLAAMKASDETARYLENAKKAADRAAALVQQLLAFGRKSRIELTSVDLNKIIHEVTTLARETIDRRIDIHIHVKDNLPKVLADPTQINSVLMNLCINARDAITEAMRSLTTDEDATAQFAITIETEDVLVGKEYCESRSYARPGRFVVLSVSDNGVGMDRETQRRVFEPFFTTKKRGEGTGLGLATAYGIIKQHNGWINIYSEPGRGTSFKVYLPAAEQDEERSSAEIPEAVRGGTETVLLIDDESMIRNLGQAILERYGYKVILAKDGKEGLDRYLELHDKIDLVILDLSMPELSGREVLMRIRKVVPDAKVIINSGYSQEMEIPSVKQLEPAAFVSKPYRPDDLARTVRRVLDG